MPREAASFDYVAIDEAGRRVKGTLTALSDGGAFEQLKRQGYAPIHIRPARQATAGVSKARALNNRETAELLSDIAALLKAGSDMRTALSVIGAKSEKPHVRLVCRDLSADISGGEALDLAFARRLPRHPFVPALVAAGEAAGDLGGGLQRAAEMLGSQVRLKDQLVSVLAYPAFVLVTALIAIGIILFFVIPALAPLVEQPGADPPFLMKILVGASEGARSNALVIVAVLGLAVAGAVAAARLGLMARAIDRLMLDGPVRRTARGLVYGGFAIALGNILASGAPMGEALRLAIRSVRSEAARRRLEPVAQAVRQGASLSDVLGRVDGFPSSIARLAAIGEASGAMGATIARAGKLEEDQAIRWIETAGRLIGPALIIVLGGLIGLLMGGLLSGVSHLGDSALQ
jgi:type II secretory pathway component PulF